MHQLTYPAMHYVLPRPAPLAWRFDPLSALIGAAIALLLAAIAYRFRNELRLGWKTVTAPLIRLSHSLQASADDLYRELVVARARTLTTAAHIAPLDAVFIEPKLASHYSPSISDDESGPTLKLSLRQVLGGHPQLALLGDVGSGRTSLLAYIALSCAGSTMETEESSISLGSIRERLPLYVPLPVIDWEEPAEAHPESKSPKGRKSGDPVAKLVSGAVAAVGGKSGLANAVRRYLEAGRAIVLADGWEELSPHERQQATGWLADLIAALPNNLWMVSAGTRGYAPLTEAGFIPLTLAPWNFMQIEDFAERWTATHAPEDKESPVPARKLAAELQRASRMGASPLELALLAFVFLSDEKAPAKRAATFERALEHLLWQEQGEDTWIPAACRTALGQLAVQLQQERRTKCSREEIEAAIEAALPPSEELAGNAKARALRTLTGERGVLRLRGTSQYAFVHSLWQAYLAARQLIAVPPTTLIECLDDPFWSEVLRFYAELGDAGPLVTAWLRAPDDLMYTRLRTLGSWIGAAPDDAAWRNGAMAVMARGFLRSGHVAQVRRALAESLAETGVPGVSYLFKQALQHPDAETRAAAVRGLARTAGESDLPALESMLTDEAPIVREAAVRGLALLNVDTAIRWLEHVMLEGDDLLQPVAAEELAQFGDKGAAILVEATGSASVVTRRAATLGLAQIGAMEMLEKIAHEEEQWIVRSAAVTALEALEQEQEGSGITLPLPPRVDQLPWLISWAATLGEGVGKGDAAQRMLQRALREGDTPVRLNAAQLLGQIGRPENIEPLQTMLADPDPIVASTALDALIEIGQRYDLPIRPAVAPSSG